MNLLKESINTPWKAFFEIRMLISKPFIYFYAVFLNEISLGEKFKFYGFPRIFRHKNSQIIIGDRFENRNWWDSNPIGINHPTIITTWKEGTRIKIGNDVGISGGSIVAAKSIEIGDGTIIGANCTIIDTDFHPIKSKNRRHDKEKIKSSSIKIGRNVFLGANSIVLKGVEIPDNIVIPAGAVVRSDKVNGYKY